MAAARNRSASELSNSVSETSSAWVSKPKPGMLPSAKQDRPPFAPPASALREPRHTIERAGERGLSGLRELRARPLSGKAPRPGLLAASGRGKRSAGDSPPCWRFWIGPRAPAPCRRAACGAEPVAPSVSVEILGDNIPPPPSWAIRRPSPHLLRGSRCRARPAPGRVRSGPLAVSELHYTALRRAGRARPASDSVTRRPRPFSPRRESAPDRPGSPGPSGRLANNMPSPCRAGAPAARDDARKSPSRWPARVAVRSTGSARRPPSNSNASWSSVSAVSELAANRSPGKPARPPLELDRRTISPRTNRDHVGPGAPRPDGARGCAFVESSRPLMEERRLGLV